jgi:SAM-dependent methyltransferase
MRTTRDVNTAHPQDDAEIEAARRFYDGTDEQPATYDYGVPLYIEFVTDLVASTQAASVMEFGCNAGRNLDILRHKMPGSHLWGLDLNPKMIDRGKEMFGLDLRVSNETGLGTLEDGCCDVVFTVSVLDHIPYPEYTLRQLLRVTREYLILFELSSPNRIGKARDVFTSDGDAVTHSESYPFSYLHDYRAECERKFGALCVADIQYPVTAGNGGNMSDWYRLFVFSPRRTLLSSQLVTALNLKPIQELSL